MRFSKTLGVASGISDALTTKGKVQEHVSKSTPSLENLTNNALLESSAIRTTISKAPDKCAKKKVVKKPDKTKCLRPVPRVKLVDEPPNDCNVKKAEIPTVKLRDGHVMPMFGLGTWGVS